MKCTSNRNDSEKRGGLEQTGVHFRITKISGSRSVEKIITFFASKQFQGPLKKKKYFNQSINQSIDLSFNYLINFISSQYSQNFVIDQY